MSMDASAERRPLGKLRVTAIAGVLLTAFVGVAALASGPFVPAAAETKPTITGTGSSYAALAIDQWVAEVSGLYGDNVNYSTQSSVIGLNDFAQYPQVDFGASEIGYSTGQADQEPPAGFTYQYLPDIAGATCLDYNLTTPFGQKITNLRLDSSVMAGIFSGAITYWDDPKIKTLNPGVDLPHEPIIVVYRTDASGDNYIFSDYLYTTQPTAWNAFTSALGQPSGAQALWPLPPTGDRSVGSYTFGNWSGATGSNIASGYVYQNRGAITYVETGYALLHHDPCASVQNSSGTYVKPSEAADAIALQNDSLRPDLEQTLTPVFQSSESRAYPISAYSYLVMAEQSEIQKDKQPIEAQFIQFLACAGQEAAGQLGYSPLPPNLVQADFAAVDRIDGVQLPTPTASNCPDPYVTGAFNAAPPPTVSTTPTPSTSPGAATSPISTSGSGSSHSSANGSTSSHSSSGKSGSGSGSGSSATSGTGHSSTTSGSRGSTSTTIAAANTGITLHSPGRKHRNVLTSVLPPPGQVRGEAILTAVNRLVPLPRSVAAAIVACSILFLAVLVVPPLIASDVNRRRRRAKNGQPSR